MSFSKFKPTPRILSVTVVSANNIVKPNIKGAPSERRLNLQGGNYSNGNGSGKMLNTFVEVELGDLMRRTKVCQGTFPTWGDTFNMVLHENTGILKLHLYEQGSSNVKYDYLASCEIKMNYVDDDSTIFWAIGRHSSVLAAHAEHCGKEVLMVVPFEGTDSTEVSVMLVLREWQFTDGSKSLHSRNTSNYQHSLLGSSISHSPTGKKLKITVLEGSNLDGKDRSRKSDPYFKLQYGKKIRKTRTISRAISPVWDEEFEFNEIDGDQCLKIKCYNDDFLGNESMGSARVNLEGLEEGQSKDVWISLEKVTTGEVKLRIEKQKQEQDTENSPAETGNGWIVLVLVEARDLIAADWRGTSDPYVRVQYGNLKKRTKVVYKTLNPQWNQTFEFPDTGGRLVLHVKDHNVVLATYSIGDCFVEDESLPPNVKTFLPFRKIWLYSSFRAFFHNVIVIGKMYWLRGQPLSPPAIKV